MPARLVVVSAALVVAFTACVLNGAGRSLGESAVSGALAYARSDSGRAQIHQLSDSTLHTVATAFRRQLQPTLDSTARALLDRGDTAVARAAEQLASSVQGPLSDAVAQLIRTNLRVTGEAGRAQLALTVRAMGADLERDLTPVLERTVSAATRDFMKQISTGVRTDLKVAAESALDEVVRSGVQTGAGAAQKTTTWKTGVLVAAGVIAALLFLGIAWLVREHRRSVAALDAVTGAVEQSGSSALKTQIQHRAVDRDIEGWLRNWLVKRGYA